jgi:hypothetical protein
MKAVPLVLLLALSCAPFGAAAGVVSVNVVGYYNKPIFAGDNLIANQLYAQDNTLNAILFNGVPNGSTCTKWDSTSRQYLALSIYTSGAGWSINYELLPGEGALFHTDSAFVNTFVGEVPFDGQDPVLTFPSLDPGVFLLSCSVPMEADFNKVIGRDPVEGESVRRLNSGQQTYITSTFIGGAWDNGNPVLGIGESGFFTLLAEPSAVPEPGVYSLLFGGAAAFALARFFPRKNL